MSVRAMLVRVQRLEHAQVSPWDRLLGPFDEFEAMVLDGIALGKLDPTDAPVVLESVRRWVRNY